MYLRPTGFNLLPEVIKNLLIINGLFFLATISLHTAFQWELTQTLGLYLPGSPDFRPHQLVTHMFMHGNFGHIFFNMFALWMFGNTLENVWGGKRFLIYYLLTGFGAAFIHLGFNYFEAMSLKAELLNAGFTEQGLKDLIATGKYDTNVRIDMNTIAQYYRKYNTPTVGASGAVFGVLLAFGMMFPNQLVYIYFLFPVKVKYFVMFYGALELWNGIQNDPASNVAHFAHLGGMLIGFLIIKYWQKRVDRGYYG